MIDRFQDAQYLYWIIVVWFAVLALLWLWKRDHSKLQQALGAKVFDRLTEGISWSRRRVKLVLKALCLSFLICALARPQASNRVEKMKVQGIELLLLVDVSASMLAEDLKPSRLVLAQKELNRLLDLLPGHKVGLVGFAGSAFLMSPLTPDLSALKMFIDSLSTESVTTQGTHFVRALEVAKEAFDRGGLGADQQVRVTKVVVLVSDGEDHEPGALEVVKNLRSNGTRIFTLAAGTEKGGPIPLRDGRGRLLGYKKSSNGQVVTSSTNGQMLQKIAQEGGGSFRFLTFGGRAIKDLAAEINQLQKTDFEENQVVTYAELYAFFLALALLCFVFDLLLSEAPFQRKTWQGRFS